MSPSLVDRPLVARESCIDGVGCCLVGMAFWT